MRATRAAAPLIPPARALPTVCIVVSLCLQLAATTRLLCPPRSIAVLARLRIGCSPRLWPFIDYPMFSDPHVPGDFLAWVDAEIESTGGERSSLGLYEVRCASKAESWDEAYAREEARLRARLEPDVLSRDASARLLFVRNHLVLTANGLVPPPCDDCPERER